ncbi:hypothetical protein [Aliarcobacter lanthieri]|uniref:hypothetical protein n=1 Tax=Aliarcobacter lanthieri TaxID=1355374 RepID=UPI000478C5AF|nr:hypothetical protein [Aliarcobacter lanthieri]QKF59255.1 putative membrane protein [Aliarcobacter lanthieri]
MTKEDFKELCKFVREKRNNEVYRMVTVFDKKLFLSLAILIPIILYLLITSVMSFIYFEPTMVNISKWDNKDRATYLTITIILWIITFCFSFFKVEKNETN